MEELKKMILNRIEFLKREVDHGKTMTNSPFYGKFWEGKISAIEGYDGEIKFLEKLLEEGEQTVRN